MNFEKKLKNKRGYSNINTVSAKSLYTGKPRNTKESKRLANSKCQLEK